jgi:hypothetical protein
MKVLWRAGAITIAFLLFAAPVFAQQVASTPRG